MFFVKNSIKNVGFVGLVNPTYLLTFIMEMLKRGGQSDVQHDIKHGGLSAIQDNRDIPILKKKRVFPPVFDFKYVYNLLLPS
ncbi:hypothetical protein J6E39_03520 [bacterium]|nr:hypothetical protein [bacterium]